MPCRSKPTSLKLHKGCQYDIESYPATITVMELDYVTMVELNYVSVTTQVKLKLTYQ